MKEELQSGVVVVVVVLCECQYKLYTRSLVRMVMLCQGDSLFASLSVWLANSLTRSLTHWLAPFTLAAMCSLLDNVRRLYLSALQFTGLPFDRNTSASRKTWALMRISVDRDVTFPDVGKIRPLRWMVYLLVQNENQWQVFIVVKSRYRTLFIVIFLYHYALVFAILK